MNRRDILKMAVKGGCLLGTTALGACSTSGPGTLSATSQDTHGFSLRPSKEVVEIPYRGNEPKGTILISDEQRQLYYVLGNGEVRGYTISVPDEGDTGPYPFVTDENGTYQKTTITQKEYNPDWVPTKSILERARKAGKPLKRYYAPGEEGNELGSRSLHLQHGGVYRIHGTFRDDSVGHAASAGCYRMLDAQVQELTEMVDIGTVVKVYDDQIPGMKAERRMVRQRIPIIRSKTNQPS